MDKESARVNPEDWENEPNRQPMKPSGNRNKPSTDQRKVRRKMKRSREDRGRSQRHASIVNTYVERINPGDEIRTPTGQTTKVLSVRRHEYRSNFVYLDTEIGTTVIERGTPVQVIVGNAAQQSVTPGHPWGNTDTIPMSGKGPAGTGSPERNHSKDCPVCYRRNTLYLVGQKWRCRRCNFEIQAGSVPYGADFSNQHRLQLPMRGHDEVPVARVWASQESIDNLYTTGRPSLLARRAQEILEGENE